MTTQSIITDIRKRLLELNTGIFEDIELINWANQVQTKLSAEILDQARIKKTTLTFTSGIATLPTDFLSFYFCKDYDWCAISDFENNLSTNMLTRIENSIYVKPTAITSLDFYYYRKPLDLSALTPTLEPELPRVFDECLILGAMIRALEAMQEIELSLQYQNKYMLLVNEAKQTISINEEKFTNKPLFNYQSLI